MNFSSPAAETRALFFILLELVSAKSYTAYQYIFANPPSLFDWRFDRHKNGRIVVNLCIAQANSKVNEKIYLESLTPLRRATKPLFQ